MEEGPMDGCPPNLPGHTPNLSGSTPTHSSPVLEPSAGNDNQSSMPFDNQNIWKPRVGEWGTDLPFFASAEDFARMLQENDIQIRAHAQLFEPSPSKHYNPHIYDRYSFNPLPRNIEAEKIAQLQQESLLQRQALAQKEIEVKQKAQVECDAQIQHAVELQQEYQMRKEADQQRTNYRNMERQARFSRQAPVTGTQKTQQGQNRRDLSQADSFRKPHTKRPSQVQDKYSKKSSQNTSYRGGNSTWSQGRAPGFQGNSPQSSHSGYRGSSVDWHQTQPNAVESTNLSVAHESLPLGAKRASGNQHKLAPSTENPVRFKTDSLPPQLPLDKKGIRVRFSYYGTLAVRLLKHTTPRTCRYEMLRQAMVAALNDDSHPDLEASVDRLSRMAHRHKNIQGAHFSRPFDLLFQLGPRFRQEMDTQLLSNVEIHDKIEEALSLCPVSDDPKHDIQLHSLRYTDVVEIITGHDATSFWTAVEFVQRNDGAVEANLYFRHVDRIIHIDLLNSKRPSSEDLMGGRELIFHFSGRGTPVPNIKPMFKMHMLFASPKSRREFVAEIALVGDVARGLVSTANVDRLTPLHRVMNLKRATHMDLNKVKKTMCPAAMGVARNGGKPAAPSSASVKTGNNSKLVKGKQIPAPSKALSEISINVQTNAATYTAMKGTQHPAPVLGRADPDLTPIEEWRHFNSLPPQHKKPVPVKVIPKTEEQDQLIDLSTPKRPTEPATGTSDQTEGYQVPPDELWHALNALQAEMKSKEATQNWVMQSDAGAPPSDVVEEPEDGQKEFMKSKEHAKSLKLIDFDGEDESNEKEFVKRVEEGKREFVAESVVQSVSGEAKGLMPVQRSVAEVKENPAMTYPKPKDDEIPSGLMFAVLLRLSIADID